MAEKVEVGKMNGTMPGVAVPEQNLSAQQMNSLARADSSLGLSEGDSQSSLVVPDSQPLSQCNAAEQLPLPLGLEQNQSQGQQQQEDALDLPDASQNSIDAYSSGSPEPLPDISVSDAESLLGVSPSPYTQMAASGPGTPSGPQTANSPSYPHGFPSSNSRDWQGFPPSGAGGGGGDMGKIPGGPMVSPAPSPYSPSSYPMPGGGYGRQPPPPPPHVTAMTPGYSPYPPPPPPPPSMPHPADLPPEFLHQAPGGLPAHLMHSPYGPAGGAAVSGPPYHGMPPSMPPMSGPRGMDPSSLYGRAYHPSGMPPHPPPPPPHPGMHHQAGMMRRMDEMAGGGYLGVRSGSGGMPPEWAWQQQQQQQHQQHHHGIAAAASRYPSPLPPHMQPHSSFGRGGVVPPGPHPVSSSPRPLVMHAPSAAIHGHSASPSHASHMPATPPHDALKIHWQDRFKGMSGSSAAAAAAAAAAQAKMHEQLSPKPLLHKAEKGGTPRNMSLQGKPSEPHPQLRLHHDSLKRPLPDWSNCVEGTKPKLSKRRHLFSGDCGERCVSVHVKCFE